MTDRVFSLAALTVLELSPPDMVEAAARAGYSHVGLRLVPATEQEQHFPLVADGDLRRQTQARLRDTGIKVLDLEILRLKADTCVAAGYGIYPHLEFMPWTDVRDLRQAMRVVANAERGNGCVLVDAFHFNRSSCSLHDLAQLAPQRMRYAQLCDVAGPVPADMDEILRQARNERRFPGEGDADLVGLLRALPPNVPLSLEIPTLPLLAQGISGEQRARMALQKAMAVLAKV